MKHLRNMSFKIAEFVFFIIGSMTAMKQKTTIILALLLILSLPTLSMAEEVLIIANESATAGSFTRNDIKEIFLGQKTTWGDGTKITFAVQDRTLAAEIFLKTYVQKTASQYDTYWKKQVFTGKGKFPISFSSNRELAEYISQTPGAIGYVTDMTDVDNLKIITVQ